MTTRTAPRTRSVDDGPTAAHPTLMHPSTAHPAAETGPATAPPAIVLDHVTKTFGAKTAVDDLDLRIEPGEIVAFLGPNGAGKTTTIDMLLGLSTPTRGSVSLFGMIPRQAVCRGLVSSVMQTGGLLDDLTVRETVEYTSAIFASALDIDSVLERAGIADIAATKVKKCSGGQKQRLRFAMALLPDPGLILLDEPTTGMDVTGRRDFWAAMRADAMRGRTVLFATHYLEEADEFADRVILIANGAVVADGPAREIKAMASAKTVCATLPGAAVSSAGVVPSDRLAEALPASGAAARLAGLPGVESVDLEGTRVTLRTTDSDTAARALLVDFAARDLDISIHSLEEAFISLTSEGH